MAMIFVDGCDKYTATADLAKFWVNTDPADNLFNSSKGRYGGGCIVCVDDLFTIWKNFPVAGTTPTTDELFVSFWFFAEAMPALEEGILAFQNAEGNFTFTVSLTPTGVLNLRRGGAIATVIDSSPAATIAGATWYRIELRVVINNPTGLYELRVNGSPVIGPTTGANTIGSTTSPGAVQVALSGNNIVSLGLIYDDIIVNDSSGSTFNTFPGQVRIETIRPNAAGDSSDGTPTGAATRHEAVDEAGTHDEDVTYVALTTSGDENLFNVGNLSATPASVLAVVVNAVSKATAGPRTLRTKVKHSTTEGNGDTLAVAAGTYGYMQHAFTTNPSTNAAWTGTEVDAAQIGYEVIS